MHFLVITMEDSQVVRECCSMYLGSEGKLSPVSCSGNNSL